ncbi:DMT family transporter [Mucilaginibacter calamicampi]|uniref:DMT family transporter n=1 Tax=Mucilaginibacter calamicampi TaxID=1302352 RepID=A0ABW2YY80_9SPHI
MKVSLIALMLVIGFVLTLHLAMNGKVGSILKNAEMGNAIFWTIGACTAIIIGFTHWEPAVFTRLGEVPKWLLTAGVMGGALVFGIAYAFPILGPGRATVLMVSAQVISGLVFSHYGWFAEQADPISYTKIGGALLLLGGTALVTFGK